MAGRIGSHRQSAGERGNAPHDQSDMGVARTMGRTPCWAVLACAALVCVAPARHPAGAAAATAWAPTIDRSASHLHRIDLLDDLFGGKDKKDKDKKPETAAWCTTSSQPGGALFMTPIFPLADGVDERQVRGFLNSTLRMTYHKAATPPTKCTLVKIDDREIRLLSERRKMWVQINRNNQIIEMDPKDFRRIMPPVK